MRGVELLTRQPGAGYAAAGARGEPCELEDVGAMTPPAIALVAVLSVLLVELALGSWKPKALRALAITPM